MVALRREAVRSAIAAMAVSAPPCQSQLRTTCTVPPTGAALEQPLEALQLVRCNLFVFEDVQYEKAGRVVEQPREQMAERPTPRLLPVDDRAVDERPAGLVMLEVALRLRMRSKV